jgi:release factor glutamine methyltransferase
MGAAVSAVAAAPLNRRAWRAMLRLKLALVDRRKYQRLVIEEVEGLSLVVPPDVFNPKLLRSGELLARQVQRSDLVPSGSRVLDLGSGSGACGLVAARRGCRVVAVDINPSAVRCTRANGLLNNLQVDARRGDLFEPVRGERFDVVLFNPPFYRGAPRNHLDHAWRSPNIAERFATQLASQLTPGGHALLVLSSDGDPNHFLESLTAQGFSSEVVAARDFGNEVMQVHRVRPC